MFIIILLFFTVHIGFLHHWAEKTTQHEKCQMFRCNSFILNFEMTQDTGKTSKPSLDKTPWKFLHHAFRLWLYGVWFHWLYRYMGERQYIHHRKQNSDRQKDISEVFHLGLLYRRGEGSCQNELPWMWVSGICVLIVVRWGARWVGVLCAVPLRLQSILWISCSALWGWLWKDQ